MVGRAGEAMAYRQHIAHRLERVFGGVTATALARREQASRRAKFCPHLGGQAVELTPVASACDGRLHDFGKQKGSLFQAQHSVRLRRKTSKPENGKERFLIHMPPNLPRRAV